MDYYTSLSNYNELNSEQRRKSANIETDKWQEDSKQFQLYRSLWKKVAEEDYLPSHPLHVDIELSDACNLRCKMCAHGLEKVKSTGFMPDNMALKLIDQCVDIGVFSIKFNWRGEASLNKFLPEAIKYAKKQGILEVQFNTNGLPPDEDLIVECAESGVDRVIFSVDGFSKDTYEQIRIGGNYEKLLENINRLIEWKKKNNSSKPFVRVQMVRTKHNAHESEPFIDYWQNIVDDVRVSDVMNRGQGNQFSVGDQVVGGRRRCPQPFQRLVVGKDGRVSPCCSDWFQEYTIGHVEKNDFITIWNNDKVNNLRDALRNNLHDSIPICKNCTVKESYTWKKLK